MDLKEKIRNSLTEVLMPEYLRLENDDGISGFVVSRRFEKMSALDRQQKIEEALQKAPLSPRERRQVLMIAGLTPEEYEAVGARIRIHRVREVSRGVFEVLLHGGRSDADYVRERLETQKGIRTTEPKPISGALGILMAFEAQGTDANPLTKAKAIRVLKKDPYIEVMASA